MIWAWMKLRERTDITKANGVANITQVPYKSTVDREHLLAKMDWADFSTGATHETLGLKGLFHVGDYFVEMSHG